MTRGVILILCILMVVLAPILLQAQVKSPDFDGNGSIDFEDFFLLAAAFGSRAPVDLAKYDLDNSGLVDIGDFFLFAADFGKVIRSNPLQEIMAAPGDTMLLIPSGEFTMGLADTTLDRLLKENPKWFRSYLDEKPVHSVMLKAFYLDKYEVTNAQYQIFVRAKAWRQPWWASDTLFSQPSYPVVGVSWEDARAYCEWSRKRLPTEAEWEKAARGTDGRVYPWGNEGPDTGGIHRANYNGGLYGRGDGFQYTAPVGSFPKGVSPYGINDMSGNVFEWVSSRLYGYPYDSTDGREAVDNKPGDMRVIRGGSWDLESYYLMATYRSPENPTIGKWSIGFRCARDP